MGGQVSTFPLQQGWGGSAAAVSPCHPAQSDAEWGHRAGDAPQGHLTPMHLHPAALLSQRSPPSLTPVSPHPQVTTMTWTTPATTATRRRCGHISAVWPSSPR